MNKGWKVFVGIGSVIIIILLVSIFLKLPGGPFKKFRFRQFQDRNAPKKPPLDLTEPTTPQQRMDSNQFLNQLDKKISEQSTAAKRDLSFGGFLNVATGGNVQVILKDKSYLDITYKMLDVLEEAGVDVVQFYIYPEYWDNPEVKNYYDSVVRRIRNDKKTLFIGYQGGGKFKHIYQSFEEYKNTELRAIEEINNKYKPDYFGVVIEPKTMEKRGQIEISDQQWVELTTEASQMVKRVSPNTKVVAAVTAVELGLLKQFEAIDSVDILGLNPYRESLLVDEVVQTVDSLATKKPVYFPEAWITGDAQADVPEEQEIKFLNFLFGFTQNHKIMAVTPFYSTRFVSSSKNVMEQKAALYRGDRTELFNVYKQFIDSVKK